MNVRVAVVCGFGVYFKDKFYGEKVNGNIVDICDLQIFKGVMKLINREIDYLIFSGGKTKILPVNSDEEVISEAVSMQNRAEHLFHHYWDALEENIFVEEESFHSYQNLERSLELIAKNRDVLKSIEIISLASKESFFDIYAKNIPENILAPISKNKKLEKNVNYFFCPIGEISREKDIPATIAKIKEFKSEYENHPYDFYSHEFYKLAMRRDVYYTVYSFGQKEMFGVDMNYRPDQEEYDIPIQSPVYNFNQ